jgi:uncharacterized protein
MATTMDRRGFMRRGAALGGGLASLGPLSAYYARTAAGATAASPGYGPLILKGDLWLPPGFWYQRISQQGTTMSDGNPTPGIFDGMAAYPGGWRGDILIRNHENRERAGELHVLVPGDKAYDYPSTVGGNTKLVVDRKRAGWHPREQGIRTPRYEYRVTRDFAILGGTSTNCAGGPAFKRFWITCEEVVKGPTGGSDGMVAAEKHGYVFFIDAYADGPVEAVPVRRAGRFAHEAAIELDGIVYQTEDWSLEADPLSPDSKKQSGSVLYRYVPGRRWDDDDDDEGEKGRGGPPPGLLNGRLQALKIKGEWHANMDVGRPVGASFRVEWVDVPVPDHDDDTNRNLTRASLQTTPTRIQAQDRGAAYFDRQEGMWVDYDTGKIYFDCTTGGPQNLGQVWAYEPRRERLTLVYESDTPAQLENPDNVVIVPQTGHIFLQEDSDGEQFVRGLSPKGEIYDFAKTAANQSEFCGGCFSPDASTFYLNQQGDRGSLPGGPPGLEAITYAIYGPFGRIADGRHDDDDDDDD